MALRRSARLRSGSAGVRLSMGCWHYRAGGRPSVAGARCAWAYPQQSPGLGDQHGLALGEDQDRGDQLQRRRRRKKAEQYERLVR